MDKYFRFSDQDKKIFTHLLTKYVGKLNNHRCDAKSLAQKTEYWSKMANEYNADPRVQHQATVKQLRSLWNYMKIRHFKEPFTEKKHIDEPLGDFADDNQNDVNLEGLDLDHIIIVENPDTKDAHLSVEENLKSLFSEDGLEQYEVVPEDGDIASSQSDNSISSSPLKRFVFSDRDREVLVGLVDKYVADIDGNNDLLSLSLKNQYWLKIMEEFNSSVGTSCEASEKQLRKLWDNVKTRYKKDKIDNPHRKDTPIERKIDNIINASVEKQTLLTIKPGKSVEESNKQTSLKSKNMSEPARDKSKSLKRNFYTDRDKTVLIIALSKYLGIITSKKYDPESRLEKKACWRKVAQEFNSSDKISRKVTLEQLKKLWDNMKTQNTENRKYTRGKKQKRSVTEQQADTWEQEVEEEADADTLNQDDVDHAHSDHESRDDTTRKLQAKSNNTKAVATSDGRIFKEIILPNVVNPPSEDCHPDCQHCHSLNHSLQQLKIKLAMEEAEHQKKLHNMELEEKKKELEHFKRVRMLELKHLELKCELFLKELMKFK